jgi:glyoxylase-like metal-dependent hydrolase (beta-lactamase superfamily II)
VYEVTALRYGTRTTRKSECYYRWSSYGEPDAEIEMDYFFWVLRNGAATIVVDTGFHPESGARRGRTCLCPPVEALRRIGVDPGTVGTVVLTHLHYDHTGNVAAFPQAELVVQRSELDFWSGSEAGEAQFAPHVEPGDVDLIAAAARDGRVRLLDGDAEVAPGVAAICVGGHSPGQTVLTVAAESGPVVLASDAVHYYEELELRRPFEILVDLRAMYLAYGTVAELAARPGAALLVGHDPEVMNRFPGLVGDAADLGVRMP